MRRLIVNADDFGLTPGVNHGIAESCQNGVVTSTTLMANGGALDDALHLLPTIPHVSVGCHVVLVDGAPTLDAKHIATLVNAETSQFPHSIGSVALRALRGQLDEEQIEAEAAAQIRKLQSFGVAVSHVDTHKHTHLFPQILHPLLRAAQSCGVKALRNPFELSHLASAVSRPRLWKRYVQGSILRRFAAGFQQAVKDAGMRTPDGSIGVVATGALDPKLFRSMLLHVPEGTWELVCHPGHNDAGLSALTTRLRESRELELALLMSATSCDLIRQCGIELISYHEFARETTLSAARRTGTLGTLPPID